MKYNISSCARVLAALSTAMLIAPSALAQAPDNKLVGLWKLESFYNEIKATGEKRNIFGDQPKGYAYFSPGGRVLSLLTADSRPKPKTDADFAAAMRSMYSVSGTYTTKGDTYTVNVDVLWNENQPTKLTREFKVEGNKLTIVTAWGPTQLVQGNPEARGVSVWSRSK
jgi:hypothetical protein